MNKIFYAMLFIMSLHIYGQESNYDSRAIDLLDSMSEKIGNLTSCNFTLNTSYDVIDQDYGFIKKHSLHQVSMLGPNKMYINSKGNKGNHAYWYNGNKLIYYSYTENNYAFINAPANIIETIDTLSKIYGFDFPAADFFYPSFTDDLIENSNEIIYEGRSFAEGKNCIEVIAKNDEMIIQLWISDDVTHLPIKMAIVHLDTETKLQYESVFSNWELNPELDDALFEFNPPLTANKLTIVTK